MIPLTPAQKRVLEALAGGGFIVAAFNSPDIHVVSPDGSVPVTFADCLALEDAGFIEYSHMLDTGVVSTLTPAGRLAAGADA